MANDKKSDGQSGDENPVIVAIGASAGGVQALQTFIGSLPPKTGAAYVVVVHLDPDYRSPWPAGAQVGSARDASDVDGPITVSLTGNLHDRPAGMTRAATANADE